MCKVQALLTHQESRSLILPPSPSPQDQEFSAKQAAEMEVELKRILDEQKDERKTLEMRFLDARQDLRRSKWWFFYMSVPIFHSCIAFSKLCIRSHQFSMGNGTETETRQASATQTTSQRSFSHAETSNAHPTSKGTVIRIR